VVTSDASWPIAVQSLSLSLKSAFVVSSMPTTVVDQGWMLGRKLLV
jgi:hypothetical protein